MGQADVKVVISGDSKSLEKAFDKVGSGAKDMARDLDKAAGDSKEFASAMDRAAGATEASEGKFMGAADLLDGLGGAFGLPTDGATNLARSFGDLSGGFSTIGPLISGIAGGPLVLIAGALAAAGVAVVALYKNSETFRDIVSGAFEAVQAVAGPILSTLGDGISTWMGWLGLGGDKANDFAEEQKKAAEESLKAWTTWNDQVTAELDDIINPLNRARENSKVSLNDIKTNLADNVAFFRGWINNLTTLTDRGFGDLATYFHSLGPEAEKAVGEAIKLTDPQLTALSNSITTKVGSAGATAAQAIMAGIGGADYETLGRSVGQNVITGMWAEFDKLAKLGYTPEGFANYVGAQRPLGKGQAGPVLPAGPPMPHRAGGGPVSGGRAYLVGERGPEMFVPGMSGGIIPNGAGGTTTIQLVLDGQVVTEVVHNGLLVKQRRTPLGIAS